MPKYAVARGYKIGIYDSWKECEEQVKGFRNPKFKKFDSLTEAEDFIKQNSDNLKVENTIGGNFGIRNEHEPSVPQASSTNVTLDALNARLHNLEENFNTFMSEISSTLSNIQSRLIVLDCKKESSHQVVKEEFEYKVDETKGIKRPAEHEDSTLFCKAKKINSELPLRDVYTTTTKKTETNAEHDRYIIAGDFVCVYTDGACSKNGKLGAKAGIGVWFNKHHPLNVSEPVRGYATNNNAEIQAATKAILQASKAGITNLNIHTDSQFMINCITSWIHKWKRNNWKLSDGGPVKNKEELIALDEAIKNMDCVKWTYVKGHSGDVGNTEADTLARRGAEKYDCRITFGSK